MARQRSPRSSAVADLARAYWHRQQMINPATGFHYTVAEAQEYIRTRFPTETQSDRRLAYAQVQRALQMEFILQRSPFSRTFAEAARVAGIRLPADRVGARIDVTTWERQPDGTLKAYHTNTLYVEVGINETLEAAMTRALQWAERTGRNYGLTEPPTGRFVGPTLWPGQTPGV